MRSTAAPYTESRLTRSVANERVGFPVVDQRVSEKKIDSKIFLKKLLLNSQRRPGSGSAIGKNVGSGSALQSVGTRNTRRIPKH